MEGETFFGDVTRVKLRLVSFDISQSREIPGNSDKESEIDSASPLRLATFDVTDECNGGHVTYLRPEDITFKEDGRAIGSIVKDFLSGRYIQADEIHMLADYAAAQNKNQVLFSMLQLIATKSKACLVRSWSGYLFWTWVTKFAPDGWFGLLKRYLKCLDIDTILDVEDAVVTTGRQDGSGLLVIPGEAHQPRYTHIPTLYHAEC